MSLKSAKILRRVLLVMLASLLSVCPLYATDINVYNYHGLNFPTCPIGEDFNPIFGLDNSSTAGGGPFDSLSTKLVITAGEGFSLANDPPAPASVPVDVERFAGSTIITYNLGTYPAGSSTPIGITLRPTMPGLLMLTATVTGAEYDPNPDNNSVVISCLAEGAAIKVNGSDVGSMQDQTIQLGSNDNFSVSVSNTLADDGRTVDYYVTAQLPNSQFYSWVYPNSWVSGISPAYTGPIVNFQDFPVLNTGPLPAGAYSMYFGLGDASSPSLNLISYVHARIIVDEE
ncbi:MAG: DUF11 domain-containing protein [Desulfuromonadales bacterium]|nr:DUF11 domain-containing protein [Desulfuromonadales bacterium]